ncbi:uncharacterized protein [Miscanthus floridulus]|uniref:uncharacterized protein n=1 Tax=Miscanthus floridulus TaxID=154761 RepID=UPI003459895A
MEAAGRDGGRGPSWSYRHYGEKAGSSSSTISSSSRSGTIVSTAYTSSGSASRDSSSISMESALLQLDLELSVGTSGIEAVKKDAEFAQQIKKPEMTMKRIEGLVQEFFRGPSENRSILGGGGGMSALERWFSELGVSWVLQLDVEHPTQTRGNTWIWIKALEKIMDTIRLTASFFPDHGHGFVGMPGCCEEEVDNGKQATSLDPVQFGLFFQKAMSKMLVFVDIMFSYSLSIHGVGYLCDPFIPCLHLHGALSKALLGIKLQFHSTPSAQVENIKNEMVSLLSEKQGRAFEAIWSTLEEIRTGVIKPMDTQTPQESSDIHWDTRLLMIHINILLRNESTVTPLVSQAASLGKYVPQTGLGEAPPFISLITEMVSCLEEKLISKSQLFLDKGLGLLFLLNKSNFIRENLKYTLSAYTKVDVEIITRKDELGHYIERYIQVSWAPMLSCLSNHTPLCLGRNHSPLSKFESEFQKTYTTQKLWKVPNPELRKRLRKAVTENIIPGYTKYIEDSKVTKPKFTPQELEEMLQELYEG